MDQKILKLFVVCYCLVKEKCCILFGIHSENEKRITNWKISMIEKQKK